MDRPDKMPVQRHRQPATGARRRVTRSSSSVKWKAWWPFVGISLAIGAVIGILLYMSVGDSLLPASGQPGAATSEEPLGKAPGFSLPDQHGQTYTLTPGDGKNHLLVFYMGYF